MSFSLLSPGWRAAGPHFDTAAEKRSGRAGRRSLPRKGTAIVLRNRRGLGAL